MRYLRVTMIFFLLLIPGRRVHAQSPPPPCGTPGVPSTYIDTLNGIIAYSNDSGGPLGCYDPNAFEWECVEFVQRYYSQRFGIRLGSIPLASEAFGILQSNNQFLAYAQGSTAIPQAEDIIVFGTSVNTPYGHVAIAKSNPIIQSNGTYEIPIIEQNSYLTHVLTMQGNAASGFTVTGRLGLNGTAPITGWVRRKTSSTLNPTPAISQVQPSSMLEGSPQQVLTINGSGFVTGSTVIFNGTARIATFVNSAQITISLTTADLQAAGIYQLVVVNPGPGGGSSGATAFAVNNPIPSIGGLMPSVLVLGSPAQTLTLRGSGFVSTSSVMFGGVARSSIFVNSGQLSITVFASDLLNPTAIPVVVTNPSPGGGVSNSSNFIVSNPTPSISGLSPSSMIAGSPGQSLVIDGSGFTTASSATFSGVAHSTTFVNTGQLRIMLSSSDLGSAGAFPVIVTNPGPGGGPSFPFNLTVSNNSFFNQWTWMGGSSLSRAAGIYGSLGMPSPANTPGARVSAVAWTDQSGNFWLFGGLIWPPNLSSPRFGLNDLWRFSPSAKQWAWMGGSPPDLTNCSTWGPQPVCGRPGVYGTLGSFSAANVPGGRDSASKWVDTNGHLWLFGGLGFDVNGSYGYLNDLWEFDPSINQWAWMGGSNTKNHAGVYGTLGTPAASNVPGGRLGGTSWADNNGHFWLLGGHSVDVNNAVGECNDLWEFNPSTGEWTWMTGSRTNGPVGVYGTLGTPAPANTPGARSYGASWTDSGGHLWLFGGTSDPLGSGAGNYNDIWEFDPSSTQWTWVGGSTSDSPQAGIYGSLGTPSTINIPGSRASAISWSDGNGNLWLFGGFGVDSSLNNSTVNGVDLNDLWQFNPSVNQWTWMGGSSTAGSNGGQPGVYGTLGTPAASNTPGSRDSASSWVDYKGNFWLFGGNGFDSSAKRGPLNDLWQKAP